MDGRQTPLWTRDFIIICLLNLLLFCGFQMFPAALPPYVKSLGAPDALLGWVTAISSVGTLLARPFAGLVLDRVGRKPVLAAGVAAMLVLNVSFTFTASVAVILCIRFFHGIAWGMASTASNTVAADCLPGPRFGEGMAFFGLSASVALGISPLIALSMPPAVMFWTAGFFMAVVLGLSFQIHYRTVGGRFQAKGKSAGVFEKGSIPAACLICLSTAGFGATLTFIALFAASRGIGNIGPYFAVYTLAMLLTRPFLGKVLDRRGMNAIIIPGILLGALGMLLLSQSASMPWFLLSAAVYGMGQGALQTGAQVMAVIDAPMERRGAANATFLFGFDLGIGIGSALAGVLIANAGFSGTFLFFAILPLLGLFCIRRQCRG